MGQRFTVILQNAVWFLHGSFIPLFWNHVIQNGTHLFVVVIFWDVKTVQNGIINEIKCPFHLPQNISGIFFERGFEIVLLNFDVYDKVQLLFILLSSTFFVSPV